MCVCCRVFACNVGGRGIAACSHTASWCALCLWGRWVCRRGGTPLPTAGAAVLFKHTIDPFKRTQVPAENVLGAVNGGVKVLMSGLDYERLVLAAGPVGLMQAALDVAVPYSTERKQFGTPIGQFQVCVCVGGEWVRRNRTIQSGLAPLTHECTHTQPHTRLHIYTHTSNITHTARRRQAG